MHAQTRTAGPYGRRVLTTLLAALMLGLGALLAFSSNANAADEQGRNLFAAIAVDRSDGTYGFSFNYATRALAQARSLRECRIRSDTNLCRNYVWVRNGCAAVAVIRRSDGSLRRIAWGIGTSRAQAQTRARNAGGAASRILAWTCTAR